MRPFPIAALASLSLVAPAAGQCWIQHLQGDAHDTRVPGAVAAVPGLVAIGQPRFGNWGQGAPDRVQVFEGAPGSMVHVATLDSPTSVLPHASFGIERVIFKILIRFIDRRGKPREIEMEAAHERVPICMRRKCQILFMQLSENKLIDRVAWRDSSFFLQLW